MGPATRFYGYLREKNTGNGVAGKTIQLTVLGGGSAWTYTVTTSSAGYYELIYTNNNGIFTWAEARFNGDGFYLASQSERINSNAQPPIVVSRTYTSSAMTSSSTSSTTLTTTTSSSTSTFGTTATVTTPTTTTSTTTTTSGATTYTTTESSTVTTTTQTTNGPSYIIFVDPVDPGIIKAKNGITGKIDFSGTNAAGVLQRAIDALGSTGGLITLRSGTYVWESVPALPKDLPNWLKIVGESGTVIKLTAKGPRAFDFHKTADYDTFRNIWLEGFTVDCNNVGGQHHLVVGTYINGSPVSNINVDSLVVKNIKTINVPVDSTETNHRINVCINPERSAGSLTLSNILVEDCDFQGGNQGVVVGSSTTTTSVYIDNIRFNRVRHSLLNVQTSSFSSVHFHIGHKGRGGSCWVTDCYGEYSGDTGVEIDGMEDAIVQNVTIRDAKLPFFFTNFVAPVHPDAQRIIFDNCHSRIISLGKALQLCAFDFWNVNSVALGSIYLRGCSAYNENPTVAYVAGIRLEANDGCPLISVDGFRLDLRNIASSAGADRTLGVLIKGGNTVISLKNIYESFAGAVSGGAVDDYEALPVFITGTVTHLTVDGLTQAVDITGGPIISGISLGGTYDSCTLDGLIRDYKVLSFSAGGSKIWYGINLGSQLTINNYLRIEDCDFSTMTRGSEVHFERPQDRVYFSNTRWGV
jgi:hypothetical protein